jgi:hypothetical protein
VRILRGSSVTLRPVSSGSDASVATEWMAETRRGRSVGSMRGRVKVTSARRGGIDVTKWQEADRGRLPEALRLLADHLFRTYGLHRLDLDALCTQTHILSAALACGFVEEGRRRHPAGRPASWPRPGGSPGL